MSIYKIIAWRNEYQVVKKGGGCVFIGTKAECREWVERNGHDGDC